MTISNFALAKVLQYVTLEDKTMNKTSQVAALKMNSLQKRAFSGHSYRNGTAAQQKAAVTFAMAVKPLSVAEIETLKQMGLY